MQIIYMIFFAPLPARFSGTQEPTGAAGQRGEKHLSIAASSDDGWAQGSIEVR